MTAALTIHQPWASLIAHGIKGWETRPHPPAGWPGIADGVRRMPGVRVEPGETVLIHASQRRPTITYLPCFTDITGEPRAEGFECAWLDCRSYPNTTIPLPLGAVVATARITDVVPIVDDYDDVCHAYDGPAAVEIQDGKLWLWPEWDSALDDDPADISNQLPYGDWTPGRWAWRLGDVRMLDEPVRKYDADLDTDAAECSTSYCAGANGWGGTEYPTCSGCNAGGTRTVPVRGRQGVWRPDPALVEACGLPGEAQ